MGNKKRNWEKKYSPLRNPRRSQSLFSQSRQSSVAQASESIDSRYTVLASTIRDIVETNDFQSQKCGYLLGTLKNRLEDNTSHLPLGRIENLEVSLAYIKPPDVTEAPVIEKKFGMILSPWHRTHYIIMLMGGYDVPAVLVTKAEETVEGAINLLSSRNPFYRYPNISYDSKALRALFKFPCIKPYPPSDNYKRL
jgi:hypothetical protein